MALLGLEELQEKRYQLAIQMQDIDRQIEQVCNHKIALCLTNAIVSLKDAIEYDNSVICIDGTEYYISEIIEGLENRKRELL